MNSPEYPARNADSLRSQFTSHRGHSTTFFGVAQHGHVTAWIARELKSHVAITVTEIRSYRFCRCRSGKRNKTTETTIKGIFSSRGKIAQTGTKSITPDPAGPTHGSCQRIPNATNSRPFAL